MASSFQQILDNIVGTYRALTNYAGYNISVDPTSEFYLRASAFAGGLAVLYNLADTTLASKMVDTATGSDLDRIAALFGTSRRGSTTAQGWVQMVSSVPISLVSGALLTGVNGLSYQVSQTGTYNNGVNVPVISVDTGSNTNLPVGSVLTWSTPQANMQSTSSCSISITGGTDAEDDETLRNRLYLTFQSPPQMGNNSQISNIASSVDGQVQNAYVYSNFYGSGTALIALTGYQTSSYIGRDLPHLASDNYVSIYGVQQISPGLSMTPPYNSLSQNYGSNLSNDTASIYGQLPGVIANPYATVVSTVNNVASSVALSLTIPYPSGSPYNGYGGGWQDPIPFPVPDGYYVNNYCQVTAVSGANTKIGSVTGFGITIAAPSSGAIHSNNTSLYNAHVPIAGQSHIQWVNRSDYLDTGWQVINATIMAANDNGNDTWSVVLDTPLVFPTDGYDFYGNTGVAVGDFISPAAVNAQSYLDDTMSQYALLGPGQCTSSTGLLLLGASRYPSPNASFPITIGAQLERSLVTNNQEVYAATIPYNTASSNPAVSAPPNIYVLENVAWYPSESFNWGQ